MTKNIFTYIHNNHTSAILDKINFPKSTEIECIESLQKHIYRGSDNNIIMLGISGILEQRSKEEQLIQDILKINKLVHPAFLIIRPFEFESGVDLAYVSQKLDLLKKSGVDFEVLDLDELRIKSPNLSFAQGYLKIQKVVELIASVKFGSFSG